MKNPYTKKPINFIRRRCPHLKGQELLEAEERFRDHLRFCLKIYRRLERKEKELTKQKIQGKTLQTFDKNGK